MKSFLRLIIVSIIIINTTIGHAEEISSLKPSISETLIHDSNIYRLPNGADIKQLTGKDNASENIQINTIGLEFNKNISLQQLNASVSLVNYKYSIFDYLNFTAINYSAGVQWSVTPRLHGTVSSTKSETANNFTYNRIFNLPSQQINKNNRFSSIYDLNSSVSLIASLDQTVFTNDQRQMGLSEYNQMGQEVGVQYKLPSGSSISYAIKNSNGQYKNILDQSSNNLNSKYNQLDNTVKIHWEISGKSRADFSAAYINRTHPTSANLNFSGLQSNATLNWDMSGKTSVQVRWSRDYASYQTFTGNPLNDINYTQTDRVSFGPVWKISPKLVARFSYEFARVDYLGLRSSQRNDNLNDTSISLQWQPTRHIFITAALLRSIRKSDIDYYNFKSNITTLTAQYKY